MAAVKSSDSATSEQKTRWWTLLTFYFYLFIFWQPLIPKSKAVASNLIEIEI